MEETKAPEAPPSEDWAALPWRKLEQHLYHLQKRIGPRLGSWRSENSSPVTEIVHEVSVGPTRRRPSSDPGKSGQENRRDRWSEIRPTRRKICPGGGHSPEPDDQEETQAAQACLDTQTGKS
jgi:hypothetical protein